MRLLRSIVILTVQPVDYVVSFYYTCSHYGAQAVVVSIDPKRVYLKDPMAEEPTADSSVGSIAEECEDEHSLLSMLRGTGRTVVHLSPDRWGPNGEEYCWWPVTVKGGRELRSIDAVLLAKVIPHYDRQLQRRSRSSG